MRLGALAIITSTFATMTSIASAQVVRPLVPVTTSDTLLMPSARDANVLQPLRLGLMAGAVPRPFGTPGCDSSDRLAGQNAISQTPIAANGLRLFRGLQLTLFGFSRDGCAFDQVAGGGAAFSIPLKNDVMFMWGGGAIYLPHGAGAKPLTELEVRAGVVWTTKNGRSYNVGISAVSGGPRLSFGGAF